MMELPSTSVLGGSGVPEPLGGREGTPGVLVVGPNPWVPPGARGRTGRLFRDLAPFNRNPSDESPGYSRAAPDGPGT